MPFDKLYSTEALIVRNINEKGALQLFSKYERIFE